MKSFEGIKDPYIAPDVDEVHWFLYVVHLGTRFSRSSRDAIVEDLQHGKDRSRGLFAPACICSAIISISAIGAAISS